MHKFTADELAKVLAEHKLWRESGGEEGTWANLTRADLSGADLQDTEGSELALAQITHLPEGQFDAWKKCQDGVIVNIRIPAEARRSHGSERKSRCEWALVLQVYGPDGKPDDELSGVSQYDNAPKIEYRKGEIVRPDGWNEDRWNTCGQGIHFFLTRLEAEAY